LPAPKVAQHWRDKVFTLVAEQPNLSAASIEAKLHEQANVEGIEEEPPSARTIGRIREEFSRLSEAQQGEYAYARWPESFQSGALPWEAGRLVLDLMAELRRLSQPRPLLRHAKWYWRITQVAPDLGIMYRWRIANHAAVLETQGKLAQPEDTRRIEWWLAFRPWSGREPTFAHQHEVLLTRLMQNVNEKRLSEGRRPRYTLEPIEDLEPFTEEPPWFAAAGIADRFGVAVPDTADADDLHDLLSMRGLRLGVDTPLSPNPGEGERWEEHVQARSDYAAMWARRVEGIADGGSETEDGNGR